MSDVRRPRSRSIVLTQEALEALLGAALAHWNKQNPGRKLTREAQAELFGVSTATIKRMVSRQAVDRSSVQIAFKSVGLAWSEDHVEAMLGDRAVIDASGLTASSIPKTAVSNNRFGFWLGGIACSVLGLGFLGTKLRSSHPDRLQEPNYEFQLIFSVGTSEYQSGHYARARDATNLALIKAREEHSVDEEVIALRQSADIYAAVGDTTNAMKDYVQTYKLCTQVKQKGMIPSLYEAMGELQSKIGDLASARGSLIESRRIYHEMHDPVGECMALRDLGSVEAKADRIDDALADFDQSLVLIRGKGKTEIEFDIKGRSAVPLAKKGRVAEARALLDQCLSFWIQKDHDRWVALTELQQGQVELVAGQVTKAQDLFVRSRTKYMAVGDQAGVKESSHFLDISLHPGPGTLPDGANTSADS